MTEITSPSGSAAGWSWAVWLSKQKTYVKVVLSALLTVLGTLLGSGQGSPREALLALGAAVLAIAGRLGFDFLDYWLSSVPVDGVK